MHEIEIFGATTMSKIRSFLDFPKKQRGAKRRIHRDWSILNRRQIWSKFGQYHSFQTCRPHGVESGHHSCIDWCRFLRNVLSKRTRYLRGSRSWGCSRTDLAMPDWPWTCGLGPWMRWFWCWSPKLWPGSRAAASRDIWLEILVVCSRILSKKWRALPRKCLTFQSPSKLTLVIVEAREDRRRPESKPGSGTRSRCSWCRWTFLEKIWMSFRVAGLTATAPTVDWSSELGRTKNSHGKAFLRPLARGNLADQCYETARVEWLKIINKY